ncbi:MAG TPA: hypothetical protein VFW78_06645 [Bacteroidia bacterium]|nr:hypothetical protein [Bacteroidia bacterium]
MKKNNPIRRNYFFVKLFFTDTGCCMGKVYRPPHWSSSEATANGLVRGSYNPKEGRVAEVQLNNIIFSLSLVFVLY